MSYLKSLEMLAKRDRQIDQLKRLQQKGEYVGSSLSVTLHVGPRLDSNGEENDPDLQDVEVVIEQDGLLQILHAELHQSRDRWRKALQKELDEAAAYLRDNP